MSVLIAGPRSFHRFGTQRCDESRPGHSTLQKCTLVVEAIGDDKVRVNHQSLPSPLVILADQALEIIAVGKPLRIARALRSAEYIDVDLNGLVDPGYGPETK